MAIVRRVGASARHSAHRTDVRCCPSCPVWKYSTDGTSWPAVTCLSHGREPGKMALPSTNPRFISQSSVECLRCGARVRHGIVVDVPLRRLLHDVRDLNPPPARVHTAGSPQPRYVFTDRRASSPGDAPEVRPAQTGRRDCLSASGIPAPLRGKPPAGTSKKLQRIG